MNPDSEIQEIFACGILAHLYPTFPKYPSSTFAEDQSLVTWESLYNVSSPPLMLAIKKNAKAVKGT